MPIPFLVTEQLVREAVELVMPSILAAIEAKEFHRPDLHIVIATRSVDLREASFESSIVLQHSIGDKAKWQYPFDAIALSKAKVSWTHGISTREVLTGRPDLLQEYDVLYAGGIVYGNFAIGVSGQKEHYDEMIGNMIGAALIALCTRDLVAFKHANPGEHFIERRP